jgi:hypothetical protein
LINGRPLPVGGAREPGVVRVSLSAGVLRRGDNRLTLVDRGGAAWPLRLRGLVFSPKQPAVPGEGR